MLSDGDLRLRNRGAARSHQKESHFLCAYTLHNKLNKVRESGRSHGKNIFILRTTIGHPLAVCITQLC